MLICSFLGISLDFKQPFVILKKAYNKSSRKRNVFCKYKQSNIIISVDTSSTYKLETIKNVKEVINYSLFTLCMHILDVGKEFLHQLEHNICRLEIEILKNGSFFIF